MKTYEFRLDEIVTFTRSEALAAVEMAFDNGATLRTRGKFPITVWDVVTIRGGMLPGSITVPFGAFLGERTPFTNKIYAAYLQTAFNREDLPPITVEASDCEQDNAEDYDFTKLRLNHFPQVVTGFLQRQDAYELCLWMMRTSRSPDYQFENATRRAATKTRIALGH